MEQFTNQAIIHDKPLVTRILKLPQVNEMGVQQIFQLEEVVFPTSIAPQAGGKPNVFPQEPMNFWNQYFYNSMHKQPNHYLPNLCTSYEIFNPTK